MLTAHQIFLLTCLINLRIVEIERMYDNYKCTEKEKDAMQTPWKEILECLKEHG